MSILGRYLLRQGTLVVGGLVLLAICVLMLERLLRILEIVSVSSRPATDAVRMLLNLLPHYLGLAIPMALMLGTIITIDKLSRSEEITAMLASGVPLSRIARPFFALAAVTAALVIFTEGYLQPHTRYGYRAAVHEAVQQTFTGAFREGKFVSVGKRTFWTQDEVGQTGGVAGVFIHEQQDDGSVRIITAPGGLLAVERETRIPSLVLAGGASLEVSAAGKPESLADFGSLSFSGSDRLTAFRDRGDDAREMTLDELARLATKKENEMSRDASAALHVRVVHAVMLFAFPLIAVPLGLSYGRSARSGGAVFGLILVVLVQKAIEAAAGISTGWPVWIVAAIFAGVSGWLFYRSAYTDAPPPAESIPSLPAFKLPRLRQQSVIGPDPASAA